MDIGGDEGGIYSCKSPRNSNGARTATHKSLKVPGGWTASTQISGRQGQSLPLILRDLALWRLVLQAMYLAVF
ncbi:MAG TPA: hypothetical protein DDY49_12545 [Paenibacillaceae bacterium]|nr:hypothetical protein [Paenibacillaceae bacterium]